MIKKFKRITAYFLISLLLFSLMPGIRSHAAASESEKEALSSMKKVAENDYLILYFDEAETTVAVCVKESGDVWFSNPVGSEDDPIASGYQKKQLRSQLSVRYYNENVQEATMDSYSDCVEEGNFETEFSDDGLTVTYTLGEAAKKYLLPEVISVERLEGFAAKLESSQSKKLLRNYTKYEPDQLKESDKKELTEKYPGLEKHSIYVLKSGAKEYVREELAGYLKDIGYSQEDFDFDLADNGYESENKKPWFRIPLSYRLDGKRLVAGVDPGSVDYNRDGYYLVEVELLPYFGAAFKGTEGYIFVPDGCGALIDHDKKADSVYTARVYGQDITMNVLSQTKSQTDQALTVKLPVFGQKNGDKAFLAVITDGSAYADITASTSGRVNSYNNVYAGFQFLEYGESTLGSMVGSNSFQMYSKEAFSSSYAVSYEFLHGDEADYSGMAGSFRKYIEGNHKSTGDSLPFYAEYIGAIDKDATFLGIKYRAVTRVTTYAQAREITDRLLDAGLDNIKVVYTGWANAGLHGYAYTKIDPVSKLNSGGLNQKKFTADMGSKGVNVYYGAELQRVYRDGLFDGYSLLGSAPKYFDRSAVKEATYYLSNGMVDSNDAISLIRPTLAAKVAKAFIKKVRKTDNTGVYLGSISYSLYSDQQAEKYTDREDALLCNQSAVSELETAYDSRIVSDNANYPIVIHSSDVINVPSDSNRNLIISRTVPFYAMVLHGIKDYALDCLNMTDDYTTTLLKSAESGAGLYFKWIYADNSILKETKFDQLYSVNYENWIDKAIEDYKALNDVLGPLQHESIKKHEYIADDVVQVTYSDGTKIAVNYSDKEVTVGGTKVAPKSYGVINR